jgi:kinetochore protein Nuf2
MNGRKSMGGRQQQTYSFPILNNADIVQCMNDLEIPLTAEELSTAPKDAVRRVFESLVDMCTGVTKEELSQPAFAGLGCLNYPELHEESIPELATFRAVSKMTSICGIHDFSMRDITDPDPKRLRRQLSGVINFAKFREERFMMYTELTAKTDDLVINIRKKEEENAGLEGKLAELKSQFASEEPAIKELDDQCRELTSKIEDMNREQAVLRHDTSEMKSEGNKLKDQVAELQFTTLNAQQETENLQSQIVSSPDRIKGEMERMGEDLVTQKKEAVVVEANLRTMQSRLESINKAESELMKTLQMMNDVDAEIVKCKAATKDVKTKKAQIANHQQEIKSQEALKESFHRQLAKLQEKVETVRMTADVKREAADQALADAEQELQNVHSSHQQCTDQAENLDRATAELVATLEQGKEQHETDVGQMSEKYKRMEGAVMKYHSQMLSNITNKNAVASN